MVVVETLLIRDIQFMVSTEWQILVAAVLVELHQHQKEDLKVDLDLS